MARTKRESINSIDIKFLKLQNDYLKDTTLEKLQVLEQYLNEISSEEELNRVRQRNDAIKKQIDNLNKELKANESYLDSIAVKKRVVEIYTAYQLAENKTNTDANTNANNEQ